jgi:ribosomal protein S18 acetylase RimI-like enzyme
MSIVYTDSLENITPEYLTGFFVGWMNPPTPQTFHKMLMGSYKVWLALDLKTGQVVGVIQAISDGVLTAFIPLLEVLPNYQKQGIARELVTRMFDSLEHLYAIDLSCDNNLVQFYEKFGLLQANAMLKRNYARQNGE